MADMYARGRLDCIAACKHPENSEGIGGEGGRWWPGETLASQDRLPVAIN